MKRQFSDAIWDRKQRKTNFAHGTFAVVAVPMFSLRAALQVYIKYQMITVHDLCTHGRPFDSRRVRFFSFCGLVNITDALAVQFCATCFARLFGLTRQVGWEVSQVWSLRDHYPRYVLGQLAIKPRLK